MITKLKTTIWAIALLFSVASVMVLSSCGEDEPTPTPPIEIDPPSALSYDATTVAVGTEGTIAATISGSPATFEITDFGETVVETVVIVAVTVDASTGELSVAKESTTGVYTVEVTATNAEGSTKGTAEITIGINPDFDPTGKGYTWQYYMNQDDPWTLEGLDGEIAELPIPSVVIPTGWPAGWPALDPNDWNELTLFPYLAVGSISDLLFQLPSDIACETVGEKGDQLFFAVEDDLTLTTICHIDADPGQSVLIGISAISWANDQFSWALTLYSQIEITYVIDNPTAETFIDPLDETTPGRSFPAIRGMVEQFTIPYNVYDETAILLSLDKPKKVEVILEVHEL
ncbi:MAG: hypothetical protein KAQ62_04000 [Cyclobacteriaceae bacterium]|nr:hypothetical protein [Cyclobacteriaceae bacterium]